MAFGKAQPQQQTSGDKQISYEKRDLVFVDAEEKMTSKGKVYWRVKDNHGKGRFYSVWESDTMAQLEELGDEGAVVPCVVKVEKTGDSTFYSITAAGANADTIVTASNEQVKATRAPGGKNSEFNKRMHPDDALRVTALAHEERAIQFISMIMDDRPEGMTREQFAKGKFMGIMQFLAGFTDMPKTPTPETPKAPDSSIFGAEDPGPPDDIPF
jgi:hypothetical protein